MDKSDLNTMASARLTTGIAIMLHIVYLVAFIYGASNFAGAAFWAFLTLSILAGVTVFLLVVVQAFVMTVEKLAANKKVR